MKHYIILCFAASLILHFVFFARLGCDSPSTPKNKRGDGSLHLPSPVKVVPVDPPKKDEGIATKEAPPEAEGKECKEWFGGIGIKTNGLQSAEATIIFEVLKDGPASKAGLKVGDIILSPPVEKIKGVVDTTIQITVARKSDSSLHTVDIVRKKICTDPK